MASNVPKNMNLSLAFSPCPNDTFIFDALVNRKIPGLTSFEVFIEDVETLNLKASNGVYDITKISYAHYARITQTYQLLSSGSALGYGCGPMVIARESIELSNLSDLRIGVPGAQTTAHFLFTNFFPQAQVKKYYLFSEIENALLNNEIDAGIIIHENRFTFQEKGLVMLADLGDLWEKTYGYAIPLGGIAIRRTLPDDVKRGVQKTIAESIAFAFEHPESSKEYVTQYAQEMEAEICQAHIDLYVNGFSLDLGQQGKMAISFLLDRMKALKMVHEIHPSIFI